MYKISLFQGKLGMRYAFLNLHFAFSAALLLLWPINVRVESWPCGMTLYHSAKFHKKLSAFSKKPHPLQFSLACNSVGFFFHFFKLWPR